MVGVYIACAFVLGLGARALGMPPLVGFLAAGFALHAAGIAAHRTVWRPSRTPACCSCCSRWG